MQKNKLNKRILTQEVHKKQEYAFLFLFLLVFPLLFQAADQFKHAQENHCEVKTIHMETEENHCDFCDLLPILVERPLPVLELEFPPNFQEEKKKALKENVKKTIFLNFSLRAPPVLV